MLSSDDQAERDRLDRAMLHDGQIERFRALGLDHLVTIRCPSPSAEKNQLSQRHLWLLDHCGKSHDGQRHVWSLAYGNELARGHNSVPGARKLRRDLIPDSQNYVIYAFADPDQAFAFKLRW